LTLPGPASPLTGSGGEGCPELAVDAVDPGTTTQGFSLLHFFYPYPVFSPHLYLSPLHLLSVSEHPFNMSITLQ
jgi:hypothetical protein